MWKYKKLFQEILSTILVLTVIVNVFYYQPKIAQAATFTWEQSSWSGGADSVTTTSHNPNASNQTTGWLKYASSTNVDIVNGYPKIGQTSYSFTDDGATSTTSGSATGGGFLNGTNSSTTISGTGIGASVKLAVDSSGTGADGAYSCASGSCNLAGGTYNYTTFNISSGATTTITGTSALIIKATGDVTIAGTLNLNGGDGGIAYECGEGYPSCGGLGGIGGPGGYNGGRGGDYGLNGYAGYGPGAGGGGNYGGGGGGGHGANGSNGMNNLNIGGITYSTVTGGSGGGGTGFNTVSTAGNGGGGGGGYLKIASNGSITNSGIISANGGNGVNNYGGGGGSGGRINLISVNNITNSGTIRANGGGGVGVYGGGGGGGRIILQDVNGVITGGTITATGGIGYYTSGGTPSPAYTQGGAYLSPGTFESATIDFGKPAEFNTLTFSATTTSAQSSCTVSTGAGCAVKIQVAASSTSGGSWNYIGPDGTTNTYFTQQAGETISSSLNNNRYFRYKVYLETIDAAYTPYFNSITINNSVYNSSGELQSTKYDAGDATNLATAINWTETGTSTTETVKFQVRTASTSALLDSAAWCGYEDCSGTSYFGDNSNEKNVEVAGNHPMRSDGNDRWFQYKAILASGGGATATVDDVVVTYVVNAAPNFDATYGTNGISVLQIATSSDANWGKVFIQYKVRDVDSTSGTNSPNKVNPSFEYSTNNGGNWTSITPLSILQYDLDGDGTDDFVDNLDVNNRQSIGEVYLTYKALWNPQTNGPTNTYSTTTQIRITLIDNEGANNTVTATAGNFTLDTKTPTSSITIDSSGAGDSIAFNFSYDTNIEYRLANSSLTSELYTTVNATSTTASIAWTLNGSPSYETVYFNVRDIYGNIASSSDTAPAIGSQNYAGINIKEVSHTTTGDWKEFLSWYPYTNSTNASFYSYQIFRSASNSANCSAPNNTSYGSSPYATIYDSAVNYYTDIGVASSTIYYYKVRVVDSDSDISGFSYEVNDCVDGQGGTDNTPPIISNASSTEVQASWAKIAWPTDEYSNSRVDYGTSPGSYTASSSVSTVVGPADTHTVYLTGLTPNTVYYYKAKSTDIFSNLGRSSEYSFTTTGGPIISGVSCQTTDNIASIAWNTDKATVSSAIEYSVASNLSSYTPVSVSAVSASTTANFYYHQKTITGLSQNVIYYYRVKSTDTNSNETMDNDSGAFHRCKTTQDTKPPTISDISTPVITKDTIVVVWATDEPASSQVAYGAASAASFGAYASSTDSNSTLTNIHVGTVSSLTKETPYYYRVKSIDANSNEAVSSEQVATTTAQDTVIIYVTSGGGGAATQDTTAPSISGIEVADIGAFNATVKFKTNEDTIGIVEYGKNSDYGLKNASKDYNSSPSVALNGLMMGADFYFKIKDLDRAGNAAYSSDQTFTTKYFSEVVKDLKELANMENLYAFQNAIEESIESIAPSIIPPFIEKPRVLDITESSATIKWKTNISSYSAVLYA